MNLIGRRVYLRFAGAVVALAFLVDPVRCNAADGTAPSPVAAGEILKDLHYPKAKSAVLLAFVSREDDRPWYVDNALLLLEFPRNRWTLAHCVRNPRYPKNHPLAGRTGKWMLHDVCDAPWTGDRHFDHRPTRVEIEDFLKSTDWPARSDKWWRITREFKDAKVWPAESKVEAAKPAPPRPAGRSGR